MKKLGEERHLHLSSILWLATKKKKVGWGALSRGRKKIRRAQLVSKKRNLEKLVRNVRLGGLRPKETLASESF